MDHQNMASEIAFNNKLHTITLCNGCCVLGVFGGVLTQAPPFATATGKHIASHSTMACRENWDQQHVQHWMAVVNPFILSSPDGNVLHMACKDMHTLNSVNMLITWRVRGGQHW